MATPEDAAAHHPPELATGGRGARDDPRSYDYSRPTRACDVVMRGGITSGVVYPHALCELARTYRFASVGGTSAGAIAAAGAAAAEYGRERGGFAKLAVLPEWIGGNGNMLSLFQPQPVTRPFYRLFTAGLGRKGLGKWLRIGAAALRSFPLTALAGLLPGVALAVLAAWTGSGALAVCAVLAGVVLAVLGLALALGLRLAAGLPRALGRNGFGMCSGMSTDGAPPALTPWLADLIDDLAGKDGDGPLTFGDLRERGIDLQMMTTNVTHRRPQRMPWSNRELFFDPEELRRVFPERVVSWMEEHPPPLGAGRRAERVRRLFEALAPLRPFPAPDDLPVVVASRMSLSFPLLISAVPLRALDMTLSETRDAVDAVENGHATTHPLLAEVCWFSDGGIASNFPVHFFDAPLPTRPTFAIDLDGFHPDHPRGADEGLNIYLPKSNAGGLLDSWHRLDDKPGLSSLVGFVSGIVRTMQNHVDSGLAQQPGYRDRIVHVHTAPDEGGLNLTMPPRVIESLTLRGQAAGRALVRRFAETPGTDDGLSWDNHRWVRYRSALAAIAEQLERLGRAWRADPEAGDRSFRELVDRGDDVGPAGYRLRSQAQRSLALSLTELLAEVGERSEEAETGVGDGAPRPAPIARIVPRD